MNEKDEFGYDFYPEESEFNVGELESVEGGVFVDDGPEFYNRHYITVDERSCITNGWSDGPHPDRDISHAICINEQGGYQFRLFPGGEENPPLWDMDGIPLYAWDASTQQALPRPQSQIDADRAAIPPPPPTAQEDCDAMVVDLACRVTLLELGLTEEVI